LTYVEALIARIPGARGRLPPLKFFTELVGEIRLGSSNKRAPVIGRHDGRMERPLWRGRA
jgi:xylulokinase